MGTTNPISPAHRSAARDLPRPADEDAKNVLRALIERAEQDARLLASVLPPPAGAKNRKREATDRPNASPAWAPFQDGQSVTSAPIPAPVAHQLMKLVAAIRLHQWEKADIKNHLLGELPASAEVYADLRHRPRSRDEEHPAGPTVAKVLGTWLRQMAWKPLAGSTGDVVINSRDGEDIVDAVAELLLQLRHLDLSRDTENGTCLPDEE